LSAETATDPRLDADRRIDPNAHGWWSRTTSSRRVGAPRLNWWLRTSLEFETFTQNICSETEDTKEGIRAFVEKRERSFSGR
jgi:hypothetical protein